MNRNRNRLIFTSGMAGLMFLCLSLGAQAIVCSNCATNTQMAQSNLNQAKSYAETLNQTLNQIESLTNQAESLSYQIQNLKSLDVHSWGDAQNQLNRLASIARQGESMAYSLVDLNEKWNAQFRGYDEWANEVQTNDRMTQQYRDWGTMMQSTAKSSLSVANEMAAIQQQDEDTMSALQQNSTSATGALQVAQAGNEIGAQTTRQLQKMQTLIQADIQMTATSISLAEEKAAQRRAKTDARTTSPEKLETNIEDGKDWTHLW